MTRKWGRDRSLFDISSNTARQREVVDYALDHCDFPWKLLERELRKEAGKDRISVHWKWLTQKQWDEVCEGGKAVHPISAKGHDHAGTPAHKDAHPHDHQDDHGHDHDAGHTHPAKPPSKARGPRARRAMDYGWAIDDGRMFLQSRMVSKKELMATVFLLEGAHFVDYHLLTKPQRDEIMEIFHHGRDGDHGHHWFGPEDTIYEEMVGESFMFGFLYAFSDLKPDESRFPNFEHDATAAIGKKIRKLLLS